MFKKFGLPWALHHVLLDLFRTLSVPDLPVVLTHESVVGRLLCPQELDGHTAGAELLLLHIQHYVEQW